MKRCVTTTLPMLAAGLLACSAKALDPAAVLGEWALATEDCAESRLTFDKAGRHEALMWDGGAWEIIASEPYRVEGRLIYIEPAGEAAESQVLEVIEADGNRLLLETPDRERATVAGTNRLALVACEER
jgi:hypothetical protein